MRHVSSRASRGLLTAVLIAQGCVVFEAPLDAGRDAAQPSDAGFDAGFDAGAMDGGGVDASLDATAADTAVDAGEEIPLRPDLASCGFGVPGFGGRVSGLLEMSGVVASRANVRVVWVVQDSGSGAVVSALNDLGDVVATYGLAGTAIDYEDIAMGPGPMAGVDYLYIGDIGDNDGDRPTITVYRAQEPVVMWDQTPVTDTLVGVESIPLTYPAGMRDNAEALMVDPDTADIYVVTKSGFARPNNVFTVSAPHTPAVPREMTLIGPIYAGVGLDVAITGADISADGLRIITRSLRSANHYTRLAGATIGETLLSTTPCDAPLPSEPKGEAIGLSETGYFTVSEGISPPLYFVPFVP